MKKLLVLALVLGMASLANATIVPSLDLVQNGNSFSLNLLAPGMSAANNGTGVYFVITGVEAAGGVLNASLPSALSSSNATYGDAGDTGVFEYGLGTYGEVRAGGTVTETYNVVVAAGSPLLVANGYTLAAGATEVKLYTLNNNMDAGSISLVETILIPEPATMAILGLGGLLLRRKK